MKNKAALQCIIWAAVLAAAVIVAVPHRPHFTPVSLEPAEAPRIALSIFPSGAAYAGERVGVAAVMETDPGGKKIQLRLDAPDGEPLAESLFSFNGFAGNWQANLPWVWDSSGKDGWHTLYVSLTGDPGDPAGPETVLRYPVRILPASLQPAQRRGATWRQAQSGCCEYFYIAGTEAERDLAELIAQTEKTYAGLIEQMGEGASAADSPTGDEAEGRADAQKLTLFFLPRMYGQGGLVIQDGIFTYADRNYTGTDFSVILKHEMVHLLAYALAGEGPRATVFLQEGLAVYQTGGHYRSPETLQGRAAALITLEKYTPLGGLADSFYTAQHEAAYIEAGAFMEYLAGRFGRERVLAMFFDPVQAETPSAALDAMLLAHFGAGLAGLEGEWLSTLRSSPAGTETVRDVEFSLDFFNLIRRFQRAYAPGESMFDLWIPDPQRARTERITADFLPPPEAAEPLTLELMFLAARAAAEKGEWVSAGIILAEIGRVLDAKQRRVPDPVHVSPAAETYRGLTAAILRAGGEPLRLTLLDGEASAEVRIPATLEKEVQHWRFVRGSWGRSG